MNRLRLMLVSMLVLGGLAATLFLSRLASYGGERRRPKEPPSRPPQVSDEPTTATLPKGLVTLRVDLRSKGKRKAKVATTWDGQLSVSQGRVVRISIWRKDPRDSIEGSRWKLTTRRAVPWGSAQRKRGYGKMPFRDSTLLAELADVTPQTKLSFDTAQGKFAFALKDIRPGTPKPALKGLVQVARVASARTILSAPTEDDFASAAFAPDGKLYVAYVAFTHGKDFRVRRSLPKPPENWDILAQPTGGDQVLLLRLDGDRWAGPLPVTPPGQDVYRTALAVDGSGAAWVFWTAKRGDRWDLHARSLEGDQWSPELRLTNDPGPDIFPAATTDKAGRVWVAWQAFRSNNSNILAARQAGARFGKPMTVADSPANEWTPAIVASAQGQVAIAWDTYAKGDYDVYCRVWLNGQLGETIPIAATRRAEMRPSVTYDLQGRLWVAYEDSPEKWGKDQGALVRKGVGLYRNRSVAVRVWAQGRLWRPADDPIYAFYPWARQRKARPRPARLALPRLATDASGRIWLAVRAPQMGQRVPVGTAWFEHLAWYAGGRWSREILCPGTDNILDNRPALVPQPSGGLLVVTSSDGRHATADRLPGWLVRQLRKKGERIIQKPLKSRWPDRVNNELVMAKLGPLPVRGPASFELEPAPTAEPAAPDPQAKREATDVARARAARVTIGGRTLRLFRGEFHRHTELSQDGGGDGLLFDMWRYGLDAAGMDWIGNGDHDNGAGREYSWWITQKTTDMFEIPGHFAPMFSYERSCGYPDGHRNPVFAKRGVRTLPRLVGGRGKIMDDLPADAKRPNSPDTLMLYRYLARFDGVCASHTSGTNMGTDWRDNSPKVEPIVEIYQGCRQNYEMPGAPRSNTAENSIGGWRPYGFVSLALQKGYRLGFQSSSDHGSTHISYCNCWVEAPTREAILVAMKRRHIYGSTDNIIADVRCGKHFMGDEFTTSQKPTLRVRLVGTGPFAKAHVIKDGKYVHTAEPKKQEAAFEWTDLAAKPGTTSYYYIRGEQEDGELVWVSPMWITYKP